MFIAQNMFFVCKIGSQLVQHVTVVCVHSLARYTGQWQISLEKCANEMNQINGVLGHLCAHIG